MALLAPVALVALVPSHAAALERYFNALADDTRAFRVLGPTPRVEPAWARVLCRTDGERHLGWVAVRHGSIVGECQLARGAGAGEERRAEFALSVADAHQGQGIGRRLLVTLHDAAARRGLDTLTFSVAAENARMLAWMASLGARWTTRSGVVTGWLRTAAVLPAPVRPAAPWAAARRRLATALRDRAPRLA